MKLSSDPNILGLERRDLAVYEAMLLHPEISSIRTIAEVVGINRGTTFEVIKKLVRAGLVAGYYRNSRKYYRAEPPTALGRFAAERAKVTATAVKDFEQYAHELAAASPSISNGQFGRMYEGEEEIAALLRDVLVTVGAQEERLYRVVSSAEVSSHLYSKFRNFTKQRIAHKIAVRVIGVGKVGEEAALSERRMLTTDAVPASYIIIYGDKIAHITLTSLGDIQGSVTENSGVAQLQRLLFDSLWNSSAL